MVISKIFNPEDKNVIDILTKYIHDDLGIDTFDDSLFLDVYFTKSIIPNASSEYIAVQIKESTHNVRFDVIEEPGKIYCQEDEYIKSLKKKSKNLGLKVKYYSDSEKYIDCDSEMEYLKPEINLSSKIVELTKKILTIKTQNNKFYWVGILGDQKEWGEDYKYLSDSITALKDIIGDCSRIKIGFINNPEEILEL